MVLLVFLCSCGGKVYNNPSGDNPSAGTKDLKLDRGFMTNAQVQYGDLDANMTIARRDSGHVEVTVNKPESLSGMKVTLEEDDMVVNYNGLKLNLTKDSLASKAIGAVAIALINAALSDSGMKLASKDGVVSLDGEKDGRKYLLKVDAKTGALLSLDSDEIKMKMTFSDFVFSD